jgi:hypothetical protein
MGALLTSAASGCAQQAPAHPPAGDVSLLQTIEIGGQTLQAALQLRRVCDVPRPAADLTFALRSALAAALAAGTSAAPRGSAAPPPAEAGSGSGGAPAAGGGGGAARPQDGAGAKRVAGPALNARFPQAGGAKRAKQ